MSKDLFTHLILKHFQGTITKEEQLELDRWLKEDAAHQQLYKQLELSWQHSEDYKSDFQVDLDKGWKSISSRIEHQNKSKKVIPLYRQPALRIAASVILLLGVIWLVATLSSSPNNDVLWSSVQTNEGEVKSVTLPDSSTVWLNENSIIKYTTAFSERIVQLTGEAEFNVQHNAESPFTVVANGSKTTVLGTQFNVLTTDNAVNVSLIEGRVSFESPEANKVFLMPGQTAKYDPVNKEVKVVKTKTENINAWRTGMLAFDNEPIENVVSDLEAYFNLTIQLKNESPLECLFTGTFKTPTYDEVMAVLSFTFDLNQSEDNGLQILTINSCQ
ncbi:MAG: FecR domain-containing protein [Chitinophagales bacterium]